MTANAPPAASSFRAVLASAAAVATGPARAQSEFPGPWLDTPQVLDPAGLEAALLANLGWYLFIAATAVFVVVVALMVVAVRRRGVTDPRKSSDEEPLVRPWLIAGVAVTVVILVVTAVLDFTTMAALEAPENAPRHEIEIVGKRWWWEVRIGDVAVTANELHLPVGEPVLLRLASDNVIHSFWVPRLAGKRDLIPGDPTEMWIQAEEEGVFRGECAEFCGVQHANMAFIVVAEPPERFESWLRHVQDTADPPGDALGRRGEALFTRVGCAGCHTIRGTSASGELGPDLTHVASRRTLGAGTLPNTRGALGGWIVNPWAVKPGVHMPPQDLTGDELQALLAYLQSLE